MDTRTVGAASSPADPTSSPADPGQPLDLLLELLDLERLELNLFRGFNRDIGSGRVFGGQVLAQALVAAGRTVEGRTAHSLHGYFMLPGDLETPVVYQVDRIRDGRSFTTRRVLALQQGREIFTMTCSFHVAEEGIEHGAPMPQVPQPEELPRELDLVRAMADLIPERLRGVYTQDRPIDFRPVDPVNPFAPDRRPPLKYLWFRAEGSMPDDPILHQAVLAYASDYGLLGTALYPHGLSFMQRGVQAASLDHAVWLHRPFRVDDWLLYAIDSPAAAGARGFTRGSLFTRDGALVASTAQEGLLRPPRPE
ncbi:MAG TPA: acyl-CoA thioesterase II [Longimicrobiaceae bacterium]|nr:acyl-CoA thioesterase II [Longimicrobiaceae bacterium]